MLLAAVGVSGVLIPALVALFVAAGALGTVGVHAGGVESGLGGVVVGVRAVVLMGAVFVIVLTSFGVGVTIPPVRLIARTLAPAGRKRKRERKGKKNDTYRRGPVTVHGGGKIRNVHE